MKAWTSFSASGRVSVERSFEMFLRWKNDVLQSCLMCASRLSYGSNFTPRLVTEDDRVRLWPENEMVLMVQDLIWWGVPISMASVFGLFS